MALVLPYRVSMSSRQHLIYSTSAENAAHAALRWQLWLRKIADRQRLMKDGNIPVQLLRPWRVCYYRYPKNARYLHAVTAAETLALGEQALGIDAYQLHVEACDDIHVLWTLSDHELELQCRYIWGGKGKRSVFMKRVPAISVRASNGRTGRMALKPSTRCLAVYAIRLAQEVEAMGPDYTRRNERTELLPKPTWQREPAPYRNLSLYAQKAYERHEKNVPAETIQACLNAGFRVPIEPYTPPQRAALIGLAKAYGYDLRAMTYTKLNMLWKYGPAALDDA